VVRWSRSSGCAAPRRSGGPPPPVTPAQVRGACPGGLVP
jgi:hypothetical protein